MSISFATTPPPLTTAPATAQVWIIPIRYDARQARDCLSWLDTEEIENAGRFRFERDRLLYVESHLWLRRLLAEACGAPPESLRFERHHGAKPVLLTKSADGRKIQFSLSHTHDFAAVAITRDYRIGVDIERIRPLQDIEELPRTVCHPIEQAWLQALSPQERQFAFFRLWTAKEAYMKAMGWGLSVPPEQLCVRFKDDHRHEVEDLTPGPAVTTACHHSFIPNESQRAQPGYALSASLLDTQGDIAFHLVDADAHVTNPLVIHLL